MEELNDKQKLDVYNKIAELEGVGPELAKRWKDSGFNKEWLNNLEEYVQFTDKYDNVDDLLGDKNKAISKLYDSMRGEMPTDKRMYSFLQKHPDISREDVESWFNNVNEYKKQYEKERDEEAGRIRRSREINEDWPWYKKLATSGYEQERYIRDPKSATVGDSSAGLGSSIGSKLDLVSGAIAGAADFVPGPVAAGVGPGIRLGRDIAHKASGSPYQKEASQIVRDALTDAAANYTAFGLSNARRLSRIAQSMSSPEVKQAVRFNEATNDIQRGLNVLDRVPGGDAYKIIPTRRAIENIPDSPMKRELLEATSEWADGKVDWNKIAEIENRYAHDVNLAKRGLLGGHSEAAVGMLGGDGAKLNLSEYQKMAALNPDLNRRQKLLVTALKGVDQINTGAPGQIVMQQLATATGKRSGDVEDKYKRYSFKEAKDWYKKNYRRDFELGFVPREGDDPAKIAAYEDYKKEMIEKEFKK